MAKSSQVRKDMKNYKLLISIVASLVTLGHNKIMLKHLIWKLNRFIREIKPDGSLFKHLTSKAINNEDISLDILDGIYCLQKFMMAWLKEPEYDTLHFQLTKEQAERLLERENIGKKSRDNLEKFIVYLLEVK